MSDHNYDIEERKRFMYIGEDDSKRMKELQGVLGQHQKGLLDDLYSHFLSFPETKKFIQSDRHVTNLKVRQGRYFERILEGIYDQDYLEDRLIIGRTHERIGLEPLWYIGSYGYYLNKLIPFVVNATKDNPEKTSDYIQSLIKVIFMDMSLAIDTYIEAMVNREDELKGTFIDTLREYASNLTETVTSIVSAVSQQSAAASEQAASVNEVTATVSELRQTSNQAKEVADKVIGSAQDSVVASKQGAKAVENSVESMQEIQGQVEAIAEKILNLSEQTQQIGEIIQTVNEISEQSKLLALNAAIEAARAGEHGRGFSVVASEIRTLADQSKQATTQVRSILGEIQKATNSAVIATEEGNKKVEEGVGLANNAGENIQMLEKAIEQAADAGRMISSSSRQQTTGVEQVAEAMVQINQSTTDYAASIKQTEQISQSLESMGEAMHKVIERFTKVQEKKVEWHYDK